MVERVDSSYNPLVLCNPITLVGSCVKGVSYVFYKLCEKIFGLFVRMSVFQAAEAKHCSSRCMISYTHPSEPRRYTDGPLDYGRLKSLKAQLETIGGQFQMLPTPDGGARVQCLILKFEELKRKVEQAGGVLREENGINFIRPPVIITPQWETVSKALTGLSPQKKNSEQTGWEKLADGSFKLGKSAGAPPNTCLLRCRGPGGAFESKTLITAYLGAGIDLCLFNYRGVYESEGNPSEGGYYLDAETAYAHLIQMGYLPGRVFVSGFCLGAAVAAKLYQNHSIEGLNLILENAFTSLEETVLHLSRQHIFELPILGRMGRDVVQTSTPAICSRTVQDGFNSRGKLENLTPSPQRGSISIISTEQDNIVPKHSHQTFLQAAQRITNRVQQIFWTHPFFKNKQAHSDEPLHFGRNWDVHLQWFRPA